MTKNEFKQYILIFAKEYGDGLDNKVCPTVGQLLSLWTAYCLLHNLKPDTGFYDMDLLDLWEVIEKYPSKEWKDFNSFDLYMGQYLS